ncbi:GNAT family N-acetyltransferase [Cellulomonas endophytica]|uniref:GNAT family N-acetyltransferase n=1 Tax=Cellulomonas endophytica TaxID=2494735 RepID=UPI0010128B73|nr:GNAT family N-acetyltransferase [Cellulomonas endophytica]
MVDVGGDGAGAPAAQGPAPGPAAGGPDGGYPAGWEADVVLYDGGTTHVRPIRPDDADALQAFHLGQSERSNYLRWFAALERIPDRDLARLVQVDHDQRVALVAVQTDDDDTERIIAVARYDRVDDDTAEVAFNVSDAHQGRGLGSALLEHLAAAARERGVRRFVAEVLPQNGRMIATFREAGYGVRQRTEDGVVSVGFDIDPTERSLAVMAEREHRAEALSVRGVLGARSVVVVGPGHGQGLVARMAETVVRSLRTADPKLPVHLVGVPGQAGADRWEALAALPRPVDLAVLAVEARDAAGLVRALARHGVRAVVLLSAGFGETGPGGVELQRTVVRAARTAGIRVLGPASFGIRSVRPDGTVLDASLAREPLPVGRVGVFCQSAPVAVGLVDAVRQRGLGLAQFVSAGHRADVSGNDLMQFWTADEGTDVVALLLESIGNPRKFTRIARRLAATKPVVVVTAGRSGQVVPPGHAVRTTYVPPRTLEEMMRQAGVVRVDDVRQMLDVVQLLQHQPLPTGRRCAVLASSATTAAVVTASATAAGLVVREDPVVLPEDADPGRVQRAVDAVFAQDADAVLVVRVPVVYGPDPHLARAVAEAAARTGRTTAACLSGPPGVTAELTAPDADGRPRTVPAYATSDDAAAALARAARYARWVEGERGRPVQPPGVDVRAARRLVRRWGVPGEAVRLDPARTHELLATVGLATVPTLPAHDPEEAVLAARRIGHPVAVKSTSPVLRHRADLGGVRLDLADDDDVRAAAAGVLAVAAGQPTGDVPEPLEVQEMVPPGVPCVVRSVEDPLFGPVLSFGLAGDATDLLGDVGYAMPPLTPEDVAALIRTPRAAPRLFGYRGQPELDVPALEDVVARVSVLADALPELRSLELHPVVVARRGAWVLAARVELGPADRTDVPRRALQR